MDSSCNLVDQHTPNWRAHRGRRQSGLARWTVGAVVVVAAVSLVVVAVGGGAGAVLSLSLVYERARIINIIAQVRSMGRRLQRREFPKARPGQASPLVGAPTNWALRDAFGLARRCSSVVVQRQTVRSPPASSAIGQFRPIVIALKRNPKRPLMAQATRDPAIYSANPGELCASTSSASGSR